MPKAKRKSLHEGHSIYRGKICVVCLEKSKRPLTSNLINELKKFTNIFEKISPEDERVASGICDPCRNLLRLKSKGKNETKDFRIPSGFSFPTDFQSQQISTRIAYSTGNSFILR